MKLFEWVLIAIAIAVVIATVVYVFKVHGRAILARVDKASAWLEHRWTRIHTLAAPYGVALSTLLLSVSVFEGKWRFWQVWDIIQDTASLGAVIYAIVAISVEVLLTMVFYALGQIHKIIENNRKYREALVEAQRQKGLLEGRQEGLLEGRQEGLLEGRQEGRQEGRDAERKAWQAWYDRQVAAGVQLADPPPTSPANGA